MKPTTKMLNNAHKFTLLAKTYPEKPLSDLLALFGPTPGIDQNAAIRYAIELGLVKDPAENPNEKGTVEVLKEPETWELGQNVADLRAELVYVLQGLALKERDLEENFIASWTMGYMSHDVMLALQSLLNDKTLIRYELTDPKDLKSTYTFYTLYENGEQMWGRKNFKVEPTGAEKPDESETEDESAE